MEDNKLNIVMFPWLAFGHMLPFLELSKRLATKGHHIFFVSTPRNLERLPNIPKNIAPLITLVPLPLPRVENLPPNAEATTDDNGPAADSLTNAEFPPWIPFPKSTVYFLPNEARIFLKNLTAKTSSGVSDLFRFKTVCNSSDLVVVRGCLELEAKYLQLVDELIAEKPVLPVGLLPPSMEESSENEDAQNSIFGWLEKQRSGSVVYVALGSEVEVSQEQLTELALGLELSKLPFLWALRRSVGSSVELPDGFVERTRDRGLVWTSWAPQLKILQHDSVGGFLTHAGFSSTIETLMFGKPSIMLPLMLDQGINARFLEEKRVGIEIPRNKEDGSFTRNSVAQSLALVLQDEAGKMYRNEAKKYSPIIANESLHDKYIDELIDHLYDYKSET
uniref:Glycosyltransferase n=1 Tax=Chenopodium quinoa TaxID=63459 RepID=A0A803L9C3_CHEQI